MRVLIFDNHQEASDAAANIVAEQLNAKPDSVLGLATGSSPVALYERLIEKHRSEGLDFSLVTTFNLDEYIGLSKSDPQSYHAFMHQHLFDYINIAEQNIYLPSGTSENYRAFCQWYEKQIVLAGGIDLQVLGIGTDGHIAFNEPGSSLGSRTRIKTLAEQTRKDNARYFDSVDDVPHYAITMGVGTILEARKILLLAKGKKKAAAIREAVEGPVTAMNTASALQLHPDATLLLDRKAAEELSLKDYFLEIQKKEPKAP